MLASLDLGFVMLPHGLMLVWLHPSFNYCLLNSIFHLLKSLFLNFSFDSLYRFLNLYHLKFYSVTLFNLSSTSTIPLPFWFLHKVLIISFPPLSSTPSKLSTTLSLSFSLSPILFLFWSNFYCFNPLFFPQIVLFVIVDIIVISIFFLFLINLYKILCIFRYLGIPILHRWFDLIWVNN